MFTHFAIKKKKKFQTTAQVDRTRPKNKNSILNRSVAAQELE